MNVVAARVDRSLTVMVAVLPWSLLTISGNFIAVEAP